MEDHETVQLAIEKLRPGLASDGFDLRLGRVDDTSVEVVLEAKPDACHDCLVSDEMLTSMLETVIHQENPNAGPVSLKKVGFPA